VTPAGSKVVASSKAIPATHRNNTIEKDHTGRAITSAGLSVVQ